MLEVSVILGNGAEFSNRRGEILSGKILVVVMFIRVAGFVIVVVRGRKGNLNRCA